MIAIALTLIAIALLGAHAPDAAAYVAPVCPNAPARPTLRGDLSDDDAAVLARWARFEHQQNDARTVLLEDARTQLFGDRTVLYGLRPHVD